MSVKQRLGVGAVVWIVAAGLWVPAARAQHNKHPDDVKICYVDQLKYTNKTSNYNVSNVDAFYISEGTSRYVYEALGPPLKKNESYTVNLNKLSEKGNGTVSSLADGDEVWLRVNITLGESETCHKDGHKLVYKKGINRLIHFRSSGTTQNNNQCEYAENISNQCDGSPPAA